MKTRFKKYILMLSVLLSVTLMVSTSTAVQQTQSKQVMNSIEEKEIKKIDEKSKTTANLEEFKSFNFDDLENIKKSKITPILDFLIKLFENMNPQPEGGFLYMVCSICLSLLYDIKDIWEDTGGIVDLFEIFIDLIQFTITLFLLIPLFICKSIIKVFQAIFGVFLLIFAGFLAAIYWILEAIFGGALFQQ
jgi:hypothetical protein